MKIIQMAFLLIALCISFVASAASETASRGKVLVVMSSGHLLKLKDGTDYSTGYYLNELATPLAALIKAGYSPVFANPNGDRPFMDASSNDDKFFNNSKSQRMDALRLVDSLDGLKHPHKLSDIVTDINDYVGVFVPGGHAPMIDLTTDKSLGTILKSFHDRGLPTALICHGPMALLSTLPEADKFNKALMSGDSGSSTRFAGDWPYAGYRMAIFSKAEEKEIEQPQLGGEAPYYNDEAITAAGAKVINKASWQPNVVEDRELITAQQPFSAQLFSEAFIAKLNSTKK
ncbi:type 1 glutamine amidotransferase domain-containing protein [Klebsiella michiganensis]|uniref:type 1 glutamine amidotransferase domain-containing protein n=1 Tax=Klebsiella michiganensis TaxID=1134687 RepID=UPI0032DA3D55